MQWEWIKEVGTGFRDGSTYRLAASDSGHQVTVRYSPGWGKDAEGRIESVFGFGTDGWLHARDAGIRAGASGKERSVDEPVLEGHQKELSESVSGSVTNVDALADSEMAKRKSKAMQEDTHESWAKLLDAALSKSYPGNRPDATAIWILLERLADELLVNGKPPSREIALAITDLQSAVNWLRRSIRA